MTTREIDLTIYDLIRDLYNLVQDDDIKGKYQEILNYIKGFDKDATNQDILEFLINRKTFYSP